MLTGYYYYLKKYYGKLLFQKHFGTTQGIDIFLNQI
jgi:hypothetical protein